MPEPSSPVEVEALYQELLERFPDRSLHPWVLVRVNEQRLYVIHDTQVVQVYPVSTSKYGMGAQMGSERTPPGIHRIESMIGSGEPLGTVFEGRVSTAMVANINTEVTGTDQVLITSRILWLDGLEPGINKGEEVDSHSRYIYIHGTHEEGLIGQPASRGCVRMTNSDVIELYDMLNADDLVFIQD